jgi:hypothetical protein
MNQANLSLDSQIRDSAYLSGVLFRADVRSSFSFKTACVPPARGQASSPFCLSEAGSHGGRRANSVGRAHLLGAPLTGDST